MFIKSSTNIICHVCIAIISQYLLQNQMVNISQFSINSHHWSYGYENCIGFKLVTATTTFTPSVFEDEKKGHNLTATESHPLTTHSSPERCRMSSGRSRFPCGELGLEAQIHSR